MNYENFPDFTLKSETTATCPSETSDISMTSCSGGLVQPTTTPWPSTTTAATTTGANTTVTQPPASYGDLNALLPLSQENYTI